MPPARGDRKPCAYSSCNGTMQFSKYASRLDTIEVRAGPANVAYPAVGEEPGWVCDIDARHFQLSALSSQPSALG